MSVIDAIAQAGAYLRQHFPSAIAFKTSQDYKQMRALFKSALIARGCLPKNIMSYWARVMYREAWPGQGKVNGIFYIRLPDNSVVRDKDRNKGVTMMDVE